MHAENRTGLGRRVPDLVLVMDRTQDPDKGGGDKYEYEFRVQCEIGVKDAEEARKLFEALYGNKRDAGGVTEAHEIIRPKLDNSKSALFKTIVHLGFIDNGSESAAPAELLDAIRKIKWGESAAPETAEPAAR